MIGRVRPLLGAARNVVSSRRQSAAVILGYHNVVEAGPVPRGHELTVTTVQLHRHIRLLRRLGFRIGDLTELVSVNNSVGEQQPLAVLTFDDALGGVYRDAAPVLADLDVKATIFAVTGSPGKAPTWWPGAEETLTESQLAELVVAGHTLGSHTVTHSSLVSLDDDQLESELVRSREWLGSISSQAVEFLAYPSGHHDSRVREAAQAAGYTAACTFLNGRVTGTEDPMRLPRFTMGAHSSLARLAYHLLRDASSWPDHQCDVAGVTQS